MFLNLLRMERDKTLKLPLLWIGIVIIMLPIIAYYIALYSLRQRAPCPPRSLDLGRLVELGHVWLVY